MSTACPPNTQQLILNLRSSGNDEPLSIALRRACDRCRRRKTRCDGQKTCQSCSKARVDCLYLTQRKPLGRRPRKHRLAGKQQSSVSRATKPQPDVLQADSTHSTSVTECTPTPTALLGHFEPCPVSRDDLLINVPYLDVQGDITSQNDLSLLASSDWDGFPLTLNAPLFNEGLLPFSPGLGDLDPNIFQTACLSDQSYHPTNSLLPTLTSPDIDWRAPTEAFMPYVDLFFERLYPVFPVLEKDVIVKELTSDGSHRPFHRHAFFASLSAAVTVQLNLEGPQCRFSPSIHSDWFMIQNDSASKGGDSGTGEFWVSQALRARVQYDFIGEPNESTVMTSFFLFEYYGNKNQSGKAWYYLREAIGFALEIGLDDADTYLELEPRAAQRRCRLFWLLFITERAYALQQKGSATLRSCIELPKMTDSKDSKLTQGFVSLVNLFQSVDDRFLCLWKGRSTRQGIVANGGWEQEFTVSMTNDGAHGAESGDDEIVEVQRLDISITRQWLHLLAWQIQTSGGGSYAASKSSCRYFPLAASRTTLEVINGADRKSLESHGIGMEQKIFDIACCLSDLLQRPLEQEETSTGQGFLHGFMGLLASFRGRQSEYLQPLLARTSTILGLEFMRVPGGVLLADDKDDETDCNF